MTGKVPAPRKKKTLPRKQTVMLILLHKGEILLEKRPPTGIWAGLWSFPEITPRDDVRRFCAQHFGARIKKPHLLPRLEQGFSHFELSIQPLLLLVETVNFHAAEPGRLWLDLNDAQGAAVPSPVRKLMLQVAACG